MRGVQTVGVGKESESESLPPVGFASGDGSFSDDCSSDLQGVPLKHRFSPGQSLLSPDGHSSAFAQSIFSQLSEQKYKAFKFSR